MLTKYYKTPDKGLSYFCLQSNGLAMLYRRPWRLVSRKFY